LTFGLEAHLRNHNVKYHQRDQDRLNTNTTNAGNGGAAALDQEHDAAAANAGNGGASALDKEHDAAAARLLSKPRTESGIGTSTEHASAAGVRGAAGSDAVGGGDRSGGDGDKRSNQLSSASPRDSKPGRKEPSGKRVSRAGKSTGSNRANAGRKRRN
jgi:hypothetical protein